MISFCLIVNRRCQTRFVRYYDRIPQDPPSFELDVARKCIIRKPGHALFLTIQDCAVVYRVYASLYFIIGYPQGTENEFAILELIQNCVEAMNTYFEGVTELDIVCNLEKVHMIMEEIITKGVISETNQARMLDTTL
ncbi:AP complex, mu/sigma subunit [Dichotomocladium elegans]|nr:AP complex, mu/sigma subunit [Dichotomocladium elegans]